MKWVGKPTRDTNDNITGYTKLRPYGAYLIGGYHVLEGVNSAEFPLADENPPGVWMVIEDDPAKATEDAIQSQLQLAKTAIRNFAQVDPTTVTSVATARTAIRDLAVNQRDIVRILRVLGRLIK